ncbi:MULTISPECIES: MarR family winged helix-turn-helix transcriptional regulator [unclassified Lacticaseibacillus]|uniref:MarR family winged helix-turn-helix transcriptional regulator n=1 Tax=unclassified Lacticaseibacillus TaxID=2759744 RepID=UPI00194198CE|nr:MULTISPECIES: MarR family transcriptional regulator [unclassified Lacticaseibacillus]
MKLRHLQINQTLNQFSRLTPSDGAEGRPVAQQNLLFWVAAEPVPPTPTELAEAMGLSKAAITKMMGPLLDDQLLMKTIDPDDNRSFTLTLTEDGKQAVRDMSDDYFKPMNALREGLGKKKFNKLINLLDQANEVLVGADE